MYSEGFDYDNVGISVWDWGFIFMREDSELNSGLNLCVENPINVSKDLGSQVWDWKIIKDVWEITKN